MLVEMAKDILLAVGLEPIVLEDGLYLYVSPPDRPMPLHYVAAIGNGRLNMDDWVTFLDEYSRGYYQ